MNTEPTQKLYQMRASVAAAVMSNRPELLKLTLGELETQPLSLDEQKNLLSLLGDMLADREKQHAKVVAMKQRFAQSLQNITGAVDAIAKSVDEIPEE